MHEVALAADILRMVEVALAQDRSERVATLRLQAGALAGVEPRSLHVALTAMSPGTCLAGAQITIDEAPGKAWCRVCNVEVEIRSRIEPCSQCGNPVLQATSGTELRVLDLIVFDE
jgi:hydrogenase nickel incorporation protein HypA/HybF